MMELWPFSNFHDMNLDWIIKKIRSVEDSEAAAKASEEAAADSASAAAGSAGLALIYRGNAKDFRDEAQGFANDAQESADSIEESANQIAANTAAISQLIAHAGDESGNSELLNIRIAYDGETYPTAGDAVRAQAGDLRRDVGGTNSTVTTEGSNVINGWYEVETSTNLVVWRTHESYYTVNYPLDISDFKPGTNIEVKASLVNTVGVYICDNNMRCLDYINGENAASKGYTSTSEIQTVTMQLPENAFYVVTALRTFYYTSVNDFDITGFTKTNIDDLTEKCRILDDTKAAKEAGKNKFNSADSMEGFIDKANGSIYPSTSYKTTGFIDISEFQNSVCVSPKLRKALQYDENMVPIPATFINDTTNNAVITISTDAHYIRISYFVTDEDQLQIEDAVACTSYTPFMYYLEDGVNALNPTTITAIEDYITGEGGNNLRGKKWVHCGDSFSAYTNESFTNGPYAGREKTFPRLIAEKNNMTLLEQFMLSGRTLAYPADGTFSNSLTCPTNTGYFQNIPADVDYVTIMLGINDMQHVGSGNTGDGEDATGVITLGTINDNTTATYYGAWNVVLGWLRENRPFAHVGIIVTNGMGQQLWVEAIENIAKKWGYPTINLNGDDRCPTMIRAYNPNVPSTIKDMIKRVQAVDYDGTITGTENTHPNWQTHKYESTFMEDWLRSL